MKDGPIYLATPYSHPEKPTMLARFHAVNKVAAALMNRGFHVFSPISHSHPIAEAGDLPLSWDYWEKYDRIILGMCSSVLVLKIDGWDRSKGVLAEIEIARELGLLVNFVDEEGLIGDPV